MAPSFKAVNGIRSSARLLQVLTTLNGLGGSLLFQDSTQTFP